MLLNSLLLLGAAGVGLVMVMVFIYYILTAEPGLPTEPSRSGWEHQPVLDDDILYLASSMYPYQEYAYFPVIAFSTEPQAVAQPIQPTPPFGVLPFRLERQEASQPV